VPQSKKHALIATQKKRKKKKKRKKEKKKKKNARRRRRVRIVPRAIPNNGRRGNGRAARYANRRAGGPLVTMRDRTHSVTLRDRAQT
jgi:hypothetical protein